MRTSFRLRWSWIAVLAAGLASLITESSAFGIARTYVIDSAQSNIAVTGTVTDSEHPSTPHAIAQQSPGSLTTSYSGLIQTERGTNSIQFLSGSSITANNSGSWAPDPGGASGNDPANYGGTSTLHVQVIFVIGTPVDFAGRGLNFGLTSGALPVTNESFSLASTTATFGAGSALDYRAGISVSGSSGTTPLEGNDLMSGTGTISGLQQSPNAGFLREYLTIPFVTTYAIDLVAESNGYLQGATLNLNGQLKAYADIPDTFERNWINASGGTFATAANWNPAITPVAADTAVFDLNGNYIVTVGPGTTNDRLRVENDQVALALGTNTYTLTNTSTTTPSIIAGAAAGDNGRLSLTGTGAGGSLSSVHAFLGSVASSTGQVTVGSLATWNNSGELSVGRAGAGTLTINSGGKVIAPAGGISYLGHTAGVSGTATVSGSGSTWTNGQLFVGRGGTGSVTIQSSGTLNSATTNIASLAGSNGTLTVTGSGTTWLNSGSVYVGGTSSAAGGTGILNINSSASANITGTLQTRTAGTVNLTSGKLKTGTLNISQGTFSHTGGQLVATTVTGNLNRAGGSLTPGDTAAAGLTNISSSYTQQSGATLGIELGGTSASQFDRLSIGGSVSLAGTLNISIINGFMPTWGNSFQILTAISGRTGTFATASLPTLTNTNFEWLTNYGPTSGSTFVTLSVGLKGDYNGNGVVDAADYIVWRNTGGSVAQYNTWRSRFGTTASGSDSGSSGTDSSAAVPEPGIWTLIAATAFPLSRRGRRRRAHPRPGIDRARKDDN